MPVAIHGPLVGSDAEPIHRKLWTRLERDSLVLSDLLDARRFELIEGELVEKVKNHRHIRALQMVILWLHRVFTGPCVLQEPSIYLAPADTPRSDPEPDALVLNRPFAEFSDNPRPEDILLMVEVSDTSLNLDTTIKAHLYARAGIPEYWVLDVKGRRLIVYRDARAGAYHSITAFAANESVAPLAAPAATVRAGELL